MNSEELRAFEVTVNRERAAAQVSIQKIKASALYKFIVTNKLSDPHNFDDFSATFCDMANKEVLFKRLIDYYEKIARDCNVNVRRTRITVMSGETANNQIDATHSLWITTASNRQGIIYALNNTGTWDKAPLEDMKYLVRQINFPTTMYCDSKTKERLQIISSQIKAEWLNGPYHVGQRPLDVGQRVTVENIDDEDDESIKEPVSQKLHIDEQHVPAIEQIKPFKVDPLDDITW